MNLLSDIQNMNINAPNFIPSMGGQQDLSLQYMSNTSTKTT